MSTPEVPQITPAEQKRLQQIFAYGNQQMARAGYQTANEMFVQCVVGDPGNILYFKTFLGNLKKIYPERKKKGMLSFIGGKKTSVMSKKPEQVFKSAVESIAANPWESAPFLAAGGACEERGYHNAAVEYYRAAVDAEPFDMEANRVCALALRGLADYDGAIGCVNRILKSKPDDQAMRKLRNDLTVEKTIHKSKLATGDSNQVRNAGSGGSNPLVPEDEDVMGRTLTYVEQVERHIKKNPKDLANYIELAQYYYQQNNYADAEQYFAKAAEVSGNSPDMQERLLDVQKQRLHKTVVALKEEYESTADAARQAEIKPEFEQTKAEYETKNIELAQFRIQHHPGHAGYHFEYGVLLQKQRKVKEAIGEFQAAKADLTKKPECMMALGQCFQMIKQDKLAMTHYQEAIELLPDGDSRKKTLYLAAKLAFSLKDYETAEKYGMKLAEIDFAYKDLGDLLDKIAALRDN
ncbi:MAG: tetratricopeptide repeat protein [Planctomycetaceae bacterium]|jgi:tetratricopeptide (TPR) repeat protein|nr:tetratricopeptide repeat protein [Planctomycetaceae bacterium]